MMKRFLGWFVVLLFLATPVTLKAQDDPLAGLAEAIEEARIAWGAPGLAVAIVKDDALVFAEGFGVRRLGEATPVDIHTSFNNGSTTKAFVVASLAMLVDEGKISWDDRVIDHMPEFRVADATVTRELTIRDILSHRSGIQTADLIWYRGYLRPEVIKRMAGVEQASSLRSRWQYQNNMFLLASEIVARVSGMRFEDYVKAHIFAPLGMEDALFDLDEIEASHNITSAHRMVDGVMTPIRFPYFAGANGAGGINSSVHDMSLWLRFLLRGGDVGEDQLIAEATVAEMFKSQMAMRETNYPAAAQTDGHFYAYGLGWFLQDYHGKKLIMHTGSIDGATALAALMPEENLGLVIFINADHIEYRHAFMYDVLDRYLVTRDKDWSADLLTLFSGFAAERAERVAAAEAERILETSPSLPLDSYVGSYSHEVFGPSEVRLVDGKLTLYLEPMLEISLVHWQYDIFMGDPGPDYGLPGPVTFTNDSRGAIKSLSFFGIDFLRQ